MENSKNLILVIFGASGDLTSRKLIPALFSLKSQKLLPDKFAILGVGRTVIAEEEFRNRMESAIVSFSEEKGHSADEIHAFTKDIYYIPDR
jgi:glucose-6-phosphate 1-dehydrogenase